MKERVLGSYAQLPMLDIKQSMLTTEPRLCGEEYGASILLLSIVPRRGLVREA